MNLSVVRDLIGVIDDAIAIADSAVKSADELQRRNAEPVTLVKVAAARYHSVAAELMKTGAFNDHTRDSLARSLEESGTAGLLEIMEKLASRAVFPLDTSFIGVEGDLVDKSATSRTHHDSTESKTALWERCCLEAGLS